MKKYTIDQLLTMEYGPKESPRRKAAEGRINKKLFGIKKRNSEFDKKELLKVIGGNIMMFRNRKNLTQEDLANMVGLSRVSITLIENGRQAFPIYRLPLLCETLGCSVNFLFKE